MTEELLFEAEERMDGAVVALRATWSKCAPGVHACPDRKAQRWTPRRPMP